MSEERVMTLGPTPGDDVYLSLGRAIASQCPAGFEEAKLKAEVGGAVASMSLACTPEGGSETPVAIDSMAQADIQALLERVREATVREEDQGRQWNRCEVTLRKGGRFQMDVYY
jgi:hypothetical protein